MESIFSNYGIEIVVGMIFTVLAFLLFRVIYYGCIKKWKSKSSLRIFCANQPLFESFTSLTNTNLHICTVYLNWDLGLRTFGAEEVQETFNYSKLSQIEDFKTLLNEQLGYPIVY